MTDEDTAHNKGRIVYFSHGGGPLPILGDASHRAMVDFMARLPAQIPRPGAILVISAHWEEDSATVLSTPKPPLFYDYSGFPEEAYEIEYPAPGNPELAGRIVDLLESRNIAVRSDPQRGFDHGLYIPLKLMYPEADIPCLQVSLIRGLDPTAHIALGRALGELLRENLLVIGSGFSFHNMMEFFRNEKDTADPRNDSFQEWLSEVCTANLSQPERERRLIAWQQAPHARYCHPREEHLLPLHVCLGMAGKPAAKIFDDYILHKRAVAFLWG